MFILTHWGQAITWANAGVLLIAPLGTNFSESSYILIQEITLENVVCKMVAILSQPECVNILES